MSIEYIDPSNLVKGAGYSHAVSLSGRYRIIFIGGQNAVDVNGKLVGGHSLKEQTQQVLLNIEAVLEAAGGRLEDIVKFNVYLLNGVNPREGFEAFQSKWGTAAKLPVVTVLFVAGLGNPEWLVEIEAVAAVPED